MIPLGVRLGLACVNWNNDDVPEWGQVHPYAELAARAAALGYAGLEDGTGAPEDPAALAALLAGHDLALPGAYRWVTLSDPERHGAEIAAARAQAARLKAAGADVLLVAEHWTEARRAIAGRVQEHPDLALGPKALHAVAMGLDRLGREVSALGMRLALHPHVGSPIETPQEVADVMDATDPAAVGLCLDTGHTVWGGGNALRAARRYKGRIIYVHAKDVDRTALDDARATELGLLDGLRRGVFAPVYDLPPERSTVDIDAIGAVLHGARFRGWVIMECDRNPRTGDPDAEAAAARDRLASAFGVPSPKRPGAGRPGS